MRLYGIACAAILLAAGSAWSQKAAAPSPQEKPVMVEGRIVSVDVSGRSLVLKANIVRVDTFSVDKEAVIHAGKARRTMHDLRPDVAVMVRYVIENGNKILKLLSVKPLHPEAPEPVIKGEDMIVAEGVIQSIKDSGATMVIRASVERQDTFAVDSAALIRSGPKKVTLGEINISSYVNIHYVVEKGKKVVKSIMGKLKKSINENQPEGEKKYEVPL